MQIKVRLLLGEDKHFAISAAVSWSQYLEGFVWVFIFRKSLEVRETQCVLMEPSVDGSFSDDDVRDWIRGSDT